MPIRSRALLSCLAVGLGFYLLPLPVQAAVETTPPVYGAYLSGVVAGALGDADAASARLLEVLRTDPGAPGVGSQALLLSILAGRPEAAKLAAALPPSQDSPLAPIVLGNDAAAAGRWSAAEAQYRRIEHSALNDLLQPLLVAWSQQGAGRTDLALATLTARPTASPIDGVYALHAAMIADLAGRDEDAGRLYQRALALYPGSDLVFVQSYASFLARTGRQADARALVHALVHSLPLLSIAEPGLDAALPKAPVTTPVQGLARSFLTIAALIQQQGTRGQEAESFMLRFALGLQPDLSAARLLLADAQATDQPQQALASLRRIPAGDPLQPVAALRAGVIGAKGHSDVARSTLQHLVRSFPDRAQPLQALGDLLQDTHRYGAAIDAYGQAIRLMSPLNGQDWPILFARATAYDRNQQWKQAQADLQHALQLSPNQPFLLNYLGYSWVERKHDLGDARVMIERALDAEPDDGSIRDSLGWAMLRQNDFPGAVRQLERAAEQMPEDPTVNYHLGVAYWASGRRVEARDQWRWALNLHPDRDEEARIRTALRSSVRPGGDPVLAADALPVSRP